MLNEDIVKNEARCAIYEIKDNSREILEYFKNLPKKKYDFLLDELTGYACCIYEAIDILKKYIDDLEYKNGIY